MRCISWLAELLNRDFFTDLVRKLPHRQLSTLQHSFTFSAILKFAYYGVTVRDKNNTSITPTFVKEPV
jgi:hypothetical protein